MPAKAMTHGLQTGHRGVNVSNLERSREVYPVFEFDVMAESSAPGKPFAFLGLRNVIVLTLWQQGRGRFDKARPGLHHLSFQVPTMDDMRTAEARLRDMNVLLIDEGIVAHNEGSESGGIYFEDPDGIRLEIFAADGAQRREAQYWEHRAADLSRRQGA